MRLCRDEGADWGYPPLVNVSDNPVWRQTNASRYVRKFQSRRSLLMWKLYGERLDGWSNADHPTESVPGDPNTLPEGAEINEADLDFTGTIMPPADSGVEVLTEHEKITVARWIDLGCPINTGEGTDHEDFGWFLDDIRPTLTVSSPRPGLPIGQLSSIRFGLTDNYTGIDRPTLSITADITIEGRAPGMELADLAQDAGGGVYNIPLSQPVNDATLAHLYFEVADLQRNITRVERTFSISVTPLIVDVASNPANNTDLHLDWSSSHHPLFHTYKVWKSTTPYLAPLGYADAEVSSAPWIYDDIGVLGDANVNHFYLVQGKLTGGESIWSHPVGEFEFELLGGS